MYLCRYCDALFPQPTERGVCPNCGGPKPEKVEAPPLTMRATVTSSIKSLVFKKAGYPLVSIVACLATVLLVVLLGVAYAKPELRGTLQESNTLLALVLIGLNVLLNRWAGVAFAGLGFIIAFTLI